MFVQEDSSLLAMRIVNARPLERCLACEADRSELDPISSTDAMQSVDNGRAGITISPAQHGLASEAAL